tara:strand:+ start:190 stop:1248 length:1059 start_codon:yes stop_codon:yes gene_type:complete
MNDFTLSSAINTALRDSMIKDDKVICFGLGVGDPKEIFGTTAGLTEKFGEDRVFDVPVSENALTGMALGMAIKGYRPIFSHQRMDFALLTMDQIINNIAKWKFMFGKQRQLAMVIRMIVGRGWGQGPTHSQNLQALFCHIPGLKVVCPTTPSDAYELLTKSIFGDSPVIFIEHRWLHGQRGMIDKDFDSSKAIEPRLVRRGKDLTVVSSSYATIESIKAADQLMKEKKISIELIDLRQLSPLKINKIITSVKKTQRLLVLDTGHESGSISGDIILKVLSKFNGFKTLPRRLCIPDYPEPTSRGLLANYHVDAKKIFSTCIEIVQNPNQGKRKFYGHEKLALDVPGPWFSGPF